MGIVLDIPLEPLKVNKLFYQQNQSSIVVTCYVVSAKDFTDVSFIEDFQPKQHDAIFSYLT